MALCEMVLLAIQSAKSKISGLNSGVGQAGQEPGKGKGKFAVLCNILQLQKYKEMGTIRTGANRGPCKPKGLLHITEVMQWITTVIT